MCAESGASDCRQALDNRNARNDARYLDIGYDYDAYGNVVRQTHYAVAPRSTGQIHASPIVEVFSYDPLHRLAHTSRSGDPSQGGQAQQTTLNYDAIGNLTRKTDFSADQAGAYAYAHGSKPYALTAVALPTGGAVAYAYDANGNVASRVVPAGHGGDYRTAYLDYDIDNLPLRIGADAGVPLADNRGFQFRYGPDQQRYFESEVVSSDNARTRYTIDAGYEIDFHNGSQSEERYYLTDGVMLLRDTRASGSRSGLYLVARDRLGSSTATLLATRTGTSYTVVRAGDRSGQTNAWDHRSYDAFGRPRDSWGVPATPPQALSPRGFTQHEHLVATQLIHMNGRVFDPNVARFYGVDPVIQFPTNSQSLNPYSYILNNPLSGTDPTGYVIDTVWDIGSVIYDIGKIGIGLATGDDQLVKEGAVDLAVDAASTLVPFVPAGSSKVARMAGGGIEAASDARKAPTDGATRMVEGNGAATGQAVTDRGSKQASDIGKQADSGKAARAAENQREGARRPEEERQELQQQHPDSDVGDSARVGDLPKPPAGPGSVPRDKRDSKRLFTPSERAAKREEQGGVCATGCGAEIDASNSAGHHIQRHADGGRTVRENHAEVCNPCHDKLHSRDGQ